MCALRLGGRAGLAKGGTGAKDSKYLYGVPRGIPRLLPNRFVARWSLFVYVI